MICKLESEPDETIMESDSNLSSLIFLEVISLPHHWSFDYTQTQPPWTNIDYLILILGLLICLLKKKG